MEGRIGTVRIVYMNDAFRFVNVRLVEEDHVPSDHPALTATSPLDAPRASIGARRNPATEEAVLAAASDLLAEGGPTALTMEAVAKRARAGKATLYRWWPNRGRLLLAVYAASKAGFVVPDTGRLRDDLIAYVGQMLHHWRAVPQGGAMRHLIAEAQSDPDVMAALTEMRNERWQHIRDLFRRAAARGELAPGVDIEMAEERIAAQAWYWLLTDQMPAPEALPGRIDQLMLGLSA